jgi:hypothetical protein
VTYFPGAYLIFDLESMTSARELKYEYQRIGKSNEGWFAKKHPMNHHWAHSLELFGMNNTQETLFVTQVLSLQSSRLF